MSASASRLDALYEAYKNASAAQRDAARDTLIKAMYQNGYAIVSAKLRSVQPYIVSDAVAQAVIYLDRFRGEARFSSWFYGIVMSFCNRHIRENLENREVSLDAIVAEHGEEVLGKTGGKDSRVLDLRNALETLDEKDRRLAELWMEGKTLEEIGKELGISMLTAGKRWERLKRKLAARIKNAGRGEAT